MYSIKEFSKKLRGKDFVKRFDSGTKHENVASHAQCTPYFPHSRRRSWSFCCKEGGEITPGYGECKQTTLLACHKIVCLASFCQGQHIVVAWVGRALHAR